MVYKSARVADGTVYSSDGARMGYVIREKLNRGSETDLRVSLRVWNEGISPKD